MAITVSILYQKSINNLEIRLNEGRSKHKSRKKCNKNYAKIINSVLESNVYKTATIGSTFYGFKDFFIELLNYINDINIGAFFHVLPIDAKSNISLYMEKPESIGLSDVSPLFQRISSDINILTFSLDEEMEDERIIEVINILILFANNSDEIEMLF